MRLFVSYRCYSVVCVLDEPIEMPFGVWARVSPRTSWWGPHPPWEKAVSRSTVTYREYPACGRYSQPYSVGAGSDAAFAVSNAATCCNIQLQYTFRPHRNA